MDRLPSRAETSQPQTRTSTPARSKASPIARGGGASVTRWAMPASGAMRAKAETSNLLRSASTSVRWGRRHHGGGLDRLLDPPHGDALRRQPRDADHRRVGIEAGDAGQPERPDRHLGHRPIGAADQVDGPHRLLGRGRWDAEVVGHHGEPPPLGERRREGDRGRAPFITSVAHEPGRRLADASLGVGMGIHPPAGRPNRAGGTGEAGAGPTAWRRSYQKAAPRLQAEARSTSVASSLTSTLIWALTEAAGRAASPTPSIRASRTSREVWARRSKSCATVVSGGQV